MGGSFTLGLRLPSCGQTSVWLPFHQCIWSLWITLTSSSFDTLFFFSDDDSMACSCFLLTALYHGSLHQRGTAAGLGRCRLLSRMPLQSSSQDSRRRCDQLLPRCVLWQAVNRMCSHDGLSSTPRMSGLSSMRMSPLISVLSLVRMTCSTKSWPKCFSTHANFSNGQCV